MEKITLLYVITGVVLILAFMNTYSILGMDQKLNGITAQVALAKNNSNNSASNANDLGIKETAPIENNQPANPQQAPVIDASADDDSFKGSENAPVTIIEFSDYQCPYCSRFYQETLPLIQQKYIDTGKVKFVYRDFPLSFHENAQKAAEAAECAGEQDNYWDMHNKIFENQTAIDVLSLKQYAKDIGLNTKQFDECLDSGAMAEEVQKDAADGQKYGVTGTPAFFINGTKLVGAQPFSAFEQIIESELAKEA